MSKHRIAALIAGGTLLLGTGMAFAGEMDLVPEDPTLAPVEEPAPDATATEPAPVVVEEEAPEVAPAAAAADAADDTAGDTAGEADGEHGSVVSEAAHNHDFDEACGNHGAYVSEVAKGGDPANPTCDDETVAGTDTSTDASPADTADRGSHGKGSAKERAAKASAGKAKHGK